MLDGLAKVAKLVEKAKSLGQTSLALTDHGGMYGAVSFYNACRKEQIKPLIGVEAYYAKNSRFDKQLKMGADQHHCLLLSKNLTGYQNLMHLVSLSHLEGFSYKPRIDQEILEKYSEGVITTTGCMGSIFNKLLRQDQDEAANVLFKRYKEVFGDGFFIELQHHSGIQELNVLNQKLIKVARQLDIDLVATNDVHYIEESDARAQDALLCVQTRKMISDPNRMTMLNSPDFFLRSGDEMTTLFHDYPEAIENTLKVAQMCDLTIPTGKLIFPHFPVPEGTTNEILFTQLCWEGIKKKFAVVTSEAEKRLKYELEIIIQKGYSTYFLITQDLVNWAKSQGIGVGPGRGSAAGSLVSYSLGITTIDPLQHGLPFERFLNPERPTPPDIDMDFADDRRDEVIEYVAQKYGRDSVAQVITFGRMEARVAIRDMGRVLGLPYEDPDKIAKLIPNDPGQKTSLTSAVATVSELGEYYKQPKFKELIDLATKVEGVIRHSSVHAAAVVIADKPLYFYTPIQRESKSGRTITQYDMYSLDCNISDDAIGLLKFDFLGLRNLSIMQAAVNLIKQTKGVEIDVTTLPLDDKLTFDQLSAGDTTGVFQLESPGMRRLARNLQPNQFSDITAMVALFRPGPMDLIPKFVEGKHHPESISYPHDSLKPILQETYGVMVYQEQILQIANFMAGYSLGEADILRRAIGKKKKKLLDENHDRFVRQSIEHGFTKEVADKVWGFIEAFANYGFNKAHAASYAMIAYQTAYLKAHHPVEYMAALMSVESASVSTTRDEKIAVAIEASKKMGISILPPHINKSKLDFSLEPCADSLEETAIRFGYSAIKNVGAAAIENILAAKTKVGVFTSFTHFILSVSGQKVNKKVLESLIKVGAMDEFGTRASMIEQLEQIRASASQFVDDVEGQDHLFKDVSSQTVKVEDTFTKLPEYPKAELLSFEKELLGVYVTLHPLSQALDYVHDRVTKYIKDIEQTVHNGQTFLFGGIITKWREVISKKSGKKLAFGQLEDRTGSIEFVVFPKTYAEYLGKIQTDMVVLMKAKVDVRDDTAQLLVDKFSIPEESEVALVQDVHHREIFIPKKTSRETLGELGKLLKACPGDEKVLILLPDGAQNKKMLLPYGIKWSDDLDEAVQELLQ